VVDFIEICNICARKAIIEAAKRTINSDKVCHSYSDLNFGITFFGTQCIFRPTQVVLQAILKRMDSVQMHILSMLLVQQAVACG